MMNKRAAGLAALAMVASGALGTAALAQPGMGMLGQRQIGGDAGRDTIPVRTSDDYRTLMICVDDAPVHFQEVTVRFQNGTTRNIRLRSVIAAGRCSREIELHGRGSLAGVDVSYDAASLGAQRATLQLFGR